MDSTVHYSPMRDVFQQETYELLSQKPCVQAHQTDH